MPIIDNNINPDQNYYNNLSIIVLAFIEGALVETEKKDLFGSDLKFPLHNNFFHMDMSIIN